MEILDTSTNTPKNGKHKKPQPASNNYSGNSKYYKQALIDTGNFNESANSQQNLLSSRQLASKLKKIKQNLDTSSYLTQQHQEHFNLNSPPLQHAQGSPGSLNNTFSIFSMTSPSCASGDTSFNNNNHSNSIDFHQHESSHKHQLAHQINNHQHLPKTSSSSISNNWTWNQLPISDTSKNFMMDSQFSPTHAINHSHHFNTRMMANTPDSMSQVLNINTKQFDFELDNSSNKSSIDFILDQIQTKSNKHHATPEATTISNNNKSRATSSHQRTNNSDPKRRLGERTNLVSLNQACFVDNVSRQSSIRSLISNIDLGTKQVSMQSPHANEKRQQHAKNMSKIVNGVSLKQPVIVSNGHGNANELLGTGSFKKVTDLKTRANQIGTSGQNQPILAKNEIELLNDWDTFKSDEAAYDNSDILSSSDDTTPDNSSLDNNNNNNRVNELRPDTRLGFSTNAGDIEHNNNTYSTSTVNEYSDNITVRSSASSIKQLQDMNNSECASEECSILISPRSNGPFEYYKRDSNSTDLKQRCQYGTESESVASKRPESQQSVLSNFISNLKFEEKNFNSQNCNMNNFDEDYSSNQVHLVDDYDNEYDSEVLSEIYQDGDSTDILTPRPDLNINNTNLSFRQQSFYDNHSQTAVDMANLNYSNLASFDKTRNPTTTAIADTAGLDRTASTKRVENYQRLSNSINDLFANLLNQLETNKQKSYLNNNNTGINNNNKYSSDQYHTNLDSTVTDETLNGPNNDKTLSYTDLSNQMQPNSNKTTTSNVNKKQNLSKDSNKDSGFNQEFLTDSLYRNKYYAKESGGSVSPAAADKQEQAYHEYQNGISLDNLAKNGTNEAFLLDRYLNNEQLVAYKHSQVESYLSKVYAISFSDNDFGMLDYMQNQEGLSKTTFKKLIREKFPNFEWTSEVLRTLHEIVNQKTEVVIGELNVEDGGFDEDVMYHPKEADSTSPSSSSSVSFKRLREIKAISSLTRKERNQSSQHHTPTHSDGGGMTNQQEDLILNLQNSFVQRRQRKGSLPEFHVSQSNLNDTTLVFSEIATNSQPRFNETSIILNNANNGNNNNSVINSANGYDMSSLSMRSKTGTCKERSSRRSAFVLDPMRTSMFRSKSLTDLNHSLVKRDGTRGSTKNLDEANNQTSCNNLTLNNNSIIENGISTLNLSKVSDPAIELQKLENSYSGVIWQCADMAYNEFKYETKYEELRWLMNGDRLSTINKLKEYDQRLKIELNLKEKNASMFESLTHKKKDVQARFDNQLQVIENKIKEIELIRLYLRVCEINSHGMDNVNLNEFFNKPVLQVEASRPDAVELKQFNTLQGKSCDEILMSLYGREAVSEGYLYQFFVTYRYMFSSIELLEFFKESFNKAFYMYSKKKLTELPILDRTIDILAIWIDGFYLIDFQQNESLFYMVDSFIENEIRRYDDTKSKTLSNLLKNPNIEFNLFASKKSLSVNTTIDKSNSTVKKGDSNLSKIKNNSALLTKRIYKNIKQRSKSTEPGLAVTEDTSMSISSFRKDFVLADYTVDLIASQLTLIEWDNFLDIHVCHCLNSKAQGVNCDAKQPIDPANITSNQCLFVDNYLCKSLYKMIQFNHLLKHWVTAEILMIDNSKIQADLIVRLLKICKKCYEWLNFSTAFSIFDGLSDISIKNLRSWQHVSNKHLQIMEKIRSYKLLFQAEPFLVNHLVKTTNKPVIPNMHLFLLNVQQSEHGSFQLANGEWKWSKLSYLANLVDQIRVVQQHYVFEFEPNDEFVDDLLQRIYSFKDCDLNQLAEYNYNSQKISVSNSTIKSLIPKKRSVI